MESQQNTKGSTVRKSVLRDTFSRFSSKRGSLGQDNDFEKHKQQIKQIFTEFEQENPPLADGTIGITYD